MTALTPLKPADVAVRLKTGRAVLVDIRELDEFAREQVVGAFHAPLSDWERAAFKLPQGLDVIYTCRTGNRTGLHGERLASRLPGEAFVLEGGMEGWKADGLPTRTDRSKPIELMRQVQMTAGGMILIGAALGTLVHPAFWAVTALVGAGLFVAGATGFCGMARFLATMPWNRTTLKAG